MAAIEPDESDLFVELTSNDFDGFEQINVLGEDDRNIVGVAPAVMHEVCGEVHVRALLLRVMHLDEAGAGGRRIYEGSPLCFREEVTLVDRKPLNGLEGVEIELLTPRLVRIGAARNASGVVPNFADLILRVEEASRELPQIEPFVGRSFECSVVEVEPVYIHESAHPHPLEKARAARLSPGQPLGR